MTAHKFMITVENPLEGYMKKIPLVLASLVLFAAIADASAEIVAVTVKGEVAVSTGDTLKPLVAGAKLAEGTKICTGIHSSAVIRIDDHQLTIGPASSVKVYKNSSTESTSDTSVGLQYGTVRAKVKKLSTVKTRFNITTPVATSSVRGTEEIVSYGAASGMKIRVVEGSISAHNDRGISNIIRGRGQFVLNSGSARPDAVNTALRKDATVSVTPSGVTKEERDAVDRSGGENLVVDRNPVAVTGSSRVSVQILWPNQ